MSVIRHLSQLLALGAILALLPLGETVAVAQTPSGYAGLYVVSSPFSGRTYYPLPLSIATAPQIDGVYISLQWDEIEPAAGRYDWAALDRLLSAAVNAGKKIEIGITGGGRTPAWVYAQGVPAHRLVINLPPRADACHEITVPTYWDPRYISAYQQVTHALTAHLRTQPRWYDAVRIVKLGGINANSEELYIPAQEPISPNPCTNGKEVTDALLVWQSAGYRPSKIVNAWVQMATTTARAFPDKLLALDIIETNSDFPRIDDGGQAVRISTAISPTYVSVMRLVLQQALTLFRGRIAIQWDALSQVPLALHARDVIAARDQGAVIGWQTNGRGGTRMGSMCGPANRDPCTNETYRLLLQNGIDTGGSYIEVSPINVQPLAQALQDAQLRLRALNR